MAKKNVDKNVVNFRCLTEKAFGFRIKKEEGFISFEISENFGASWIDFMDIDPDGTFIFNKSELKKMGLREA